MPSWRHVILKVDRNMFDEMSKRKNDSLMCTSQEGSDCSGVGVYTTLAAEVGALCGLLHGEANEKVDCRELSKGLVITSDVRRNYVNVIKAQRRMGFKKLQMETVDVVMVVELVCIVLRNWIPKEKEEKTKPINDKAELGNGKDVKGNSQSYSAIDQIISPIMMGRESTFVCMIDEDYEAHIGPSTLIDSAGAHLCANCRAMNEFEGPILALEQANLSHCPGWQSPLTQGKSMADMALKQTQTQIKGLGLEAEASPHTRNTHQRSCEDLGLL
ncbi:hypothetical protein Tco_0943862 [Tanacetum coccineum]